MRDAGGKLALDYARSGPPTGPGGANMGGPPEPRAATVALLEEGVEVWRCRERDRGEVTRAFISSHVQ